MNAPARKIYAFHGGIHPEENKHQSNQSDIRSLSLPPRLIVPVRQHIGNAAKVIVSVGDSVLKGETLAEADGFISAPVHAPSSGTIIAIQDHQIPHSSGLSDLCVVIEPDGKDQWCELKPNTDYSELSIPELQTLIREAGIAGMGGAGFPTSVKMHPPKQDKVATLILNAAECEPYITADDTLMRERANEVIGGMEIMAYMLSPGECLIGIEDNKPEAIAALREAAKETRIEIVVVPTKYPSGGEKQLIKLLTDKEVPSGRIPADVGVVCQNVGTAAAVFRAVRYGEPLISRITTVTGEQIPTPGNAEVLIGSPIEWLLSQFDYHPTQPERVVMGGPMMGFALTDLDIPVVKTTNCLLAPSLGEMPLPEPAQACIRCGLCADACPAELLPQQLYWFARAQEHDKAEHHNLFDCIECGACSYVCPSSIPLVQYYRHAKGEIKQQRADHEKSEKARIRFETRVARQEREKQEKEAKRKARAEAAAKAQAAKAAAANTSGPVAQGSLPESTPITAPATSVQSETGPDLVTLKDNWDKAQSKLDKMLDALEAAKTDNPDQLPKLTRAVEKNQMRVNQARQAFESAEKAQQAPLAEPPSKTAATETPDIETLEKALANALGKLEKMEHSLAEAKESQPDLVDKLTRAVDKNKIRVEHAQQALASAQEQSHRQSSPDPVAEPRTGAELPDIAGLEKSLENAQIKLEKMESSLEDARQNQPDLVEKLERAVAKNQVRVNAARDALNSAQARVNDQSGAK